MPPPHSTPRGVRQELNQILVQEGERLGISDTIRALIDAHTPEIDIRRHLEDTATTRQKERQDRERFHAQTHEGNALKMRAEKLPHPKQEIDDLLAQIQEDDILRGPRRAFDLLAYPLKARITEKEEALKPKKRSS